MRKFQQTHNTLTVVFHKIYLCTVINTDYDRRVALHCNLPAIYFRIIPRVNQQTAAAVDIHICHADDMCICFDIRQTNEITTENY